MGFSSESYTFMTMCRLHINNYYFFEEFQIFGQPPEGTILITLGVEDTQGLDDI